MVRRCTVPTAREYPHYGGRGITVCEQWLGLPDGLLRFVADMGERPEGGHWTASTTTGAMSRATAVGDAEQQNGNRRTVAALTRERDALLARLASLDGTLADLS